MIKFFRIPILLFVLGHSAHAVTGLELMQKHKKLHEVDAEYTHLSMTLIDRKERKRERELLIYAKKNKQTENRSLLKFIKPRSINNVGLLTWEHAGEAEDDQWLYLPASKRIKRIAGGGKKNPFMGSDLAYEDMRAEDLNSHTYTLLREEVIDGQACWVIEILPATKEEKRQSGYAKRLIWLRKDITYMVRMDFFNRRNTLFKTAHYHGLEQVSGDVWRYKRLSMNNKQKKTSTIMQIKKRLIGLDINENQFNKRQLKKAPEPISIK